MSCLNIVWMIVSPSSAHSFGVSVVRDDVVVVSELFVTDGAYASLLSDFPVQHLAHLGRRSQFPVSSWVMRIINALHSHPYYYCSFAFLSYRFPAAAE